jgi:ligand-binding SRPBCC domain-containing protein
MDTYERSVRVAAPFDAVWDFHSDESGLVALTPEWMNLEIESVTGPDGQPDPDVLEAGAEIHSSVRPLNVGPRQDWMTKITKHEESGGSAYFVDVMAEGPFPEWEHTHMFYADGEETIIRDRVRYEFPLGALGRAVGPLGVVGFEPFFQYRHRRTKALLEE